MTDTFLTLSERYEMLKLSHQRRKATKLVLEDVAADVEQSDELGVKDDGEE